MEEKWNAFMETVDDCFRGFVHQIHDYWIGQGCHCDIKAAKSGDAVSYPWAKQRGFQRLLFPEKQE